MLKSLTTLPALLVCLCGLPSARAADSAQSAVMLDPNLPIYHPLSQLEGELKLGGSNTMSHVAAVWIDSFCQFYPDVKISVNIFGSRRAVEGVKTNETHIGLLSRTIHAHEVEQFTASLGYAPTVLTPCLERTAVFVHKDNPVRGLTFAQVDAMYSKERRRGAPQPVRTWGDLGVKGPLASQPVNAHGRSSDTGSQVFFQEAVMLAGAMRDDLKAHKSNIEMLKAVAADPAGVAFGGLAFANPAVRAVPLAFGEGDPFVAIDSPEADRGFYPLVRRLQLVVNHNPQRKLRPIEQEFIKYAFSQQGQEDVIKAGFQAIPAPPARMALNAVGLGVSR